MPNSDVNHWASGGNLRTLVLMVGTSLAVYICGRLVGPFVSAIVWATALAVLFAPFQRWLEIKVKRPGLAATLCVVVIGLMGVVPASLMGRRLVLQAKQGAELVESRISSGEWRRAIEAQPSLAPLADGIEKQLNLPETAKTLMTWLSSAAEAIVKGSVYQAIDLLLTFYLLFYLLRDRAAILEEFRSLSPLPAVDLDRLFVRVRDTITAMVYGTLAVSFVQGLLGGLMFWFLGLPAPLLWGVVMALLALLPVVGAFLVWVPASLYLALEGSWGKALILALWGMLIVGTIDNLLRPILVGNRLKLHTAAAFISVVGGLLLFGPAGLILGPVTLTITQALLGFWSQRVSYDSVACNQPGELERFENEGGPAPPDPKHR